MSLPLRPDRHTVVPAATMRERAGVLSFLSAQERKGPWELPRHLRVLCFMGSVELDLREARIPDGETVVEVIAWFGSVEIVVPPTMAVQLDGDAFAGDFSFNPDPTVMPPPGAPRIVIRGSAYFASVEVDVRYAGEGKRAAAKRVKAAQRKELGSG